MKTDHIKKVAIFGSCVSRDVFNTKFNKDYKDTHEVILLENQTTIMSLMSPVIKFNATSLDPLRYKDIETTQTELDKSFLKEVIKLNPDILIVDFFADARFKTISSGDSFFTVNEWKNTKTKIYKEMRSISEPFFPSKDVLSQYMHNLNQFCKQHLPETKIILNKARAVEYYVDENGETHSFNNPTIDIINKRWEMLDYLFMQIAGSTAKEINAMNIDLKADINHPWGLAPVHYSKTFYNTFLSLLNDSELTK